MSMVTLFSGGMDSTLMSILIAEEGIKQFPLFIDYGQISKEREWATCLEMHQRYYLPPPHYMDLKGYGQLIKSGLTDSMLNIQEPFLPGRNMTFLLMGCAYAYQTNSSSVAIGLLSEKSHLFPDQTSEFLQRAESLIEIIMMRRIKIVAPLMQFTKSDIIELCREKSVIGTYSCHKGTEIPCGECISCLEIINSISEV
jgi:7-cyano-7-deazaguanine synthase